VDVNADLRWVERSGYAALFAFLLFLYFPVRELLDSSAGTAHVALVLIGLAVFVSLYLSLMMTSPTPFTRRVEWLGFVGLASLALAIGLGDSAPWPLFIYVAAVAGFRLPPSQAVPTIVGCAALGAGVVAVGDYDSGDLIAYTLYVLGIGFLLLAFARALHANAELRAAREEIARLAVADERLRFARDLHDLLGHSLSVIALKSELAGRLLDRDPERAAAEVAEIEQVSREALEEVRETVTGYRKMTLVDELAGARAALTAAGIEATIEPSEGALGPETEAILAWAVREGTTNVIRHSGAQRCEIRVRAGLESAAVEVVDDGRGGEDRDGEGSGLAGLAERASRRHGRVEAGPRPDGGFRLRVSVPTA
jgi:two-component system, NarL family, sensor histidine kinase DesK